MKKIIILSGLFLLCAKSNAQGCSDAGFCSLQYHATDSSASMPLKNSLSLGNVVGIGDGKTFVNGNWITYSRQLGKRVFADIKLTSNYASGSIANHFNVGDVFLNLTYEAYKNEKTQKNFKLLGGLKLPLTSGNDKAGGKPLPMAYQSSLGTIDALVGLHLSLKNWEFTNAYQIPLTKQNKNTFLKEYSVSSDFPSSNKLQRQADVLLRVAYQVNQLSKKVSFKPNFLAIYHTSEDSYENIFGQRQVLTGSSGLTLNANLITRYKINKVSSIELSLASPLIVRTIRPDGLTRSFTAAIEYKINF